MKELSIEEKAKAYSEDEKIRKKLILSFKDIMADADEDELWNGLPYNDIIAWLEKQGKNNMGISEATKQKLEDNLHKALEKETPESCNEFLDKQGEQKETLCDKCKKEQPSHSCQDITALGRCAVEHEQKLADDTLEKAMVDAGWEFDFDKKELKKIDNKIEIPFGAKDSELQEITYYIPKGFHAEIDGDKVVIKKGEKPIAWSEEDEKTWKELIEEVKEQLNCVPAPDCRDKEDEKALKQLNKWLTWLKFIKDRVQLQNLVFTDEELAQGKKDAYNDALDKIEYRSDVPTFDDGWTAAIDFIRKKTI